MPSANVEESGLELFSIDERLLEALDFRDVRGLALEWEPTIRAALTDPVEGNSVLVGGDPGEVVVVLGDDRIEVHEYAAEWNSPIRATIATRPVGVVDLDSGTESAVIELIATARRRRRSRFRRCKVCGVLTAPESRGGVTEVRGPVCHPCMWGKFGIDF